MVGMDYQIPVAEEKWMSNPFKENRAEYEKELYKLYVEIPIYKAPGYDSAKPILIEGSRGTGKTIFLQYNSWRERSKKVSGIGNMDYLEMLKKDRMVGFYYKADLRYLSQFDSSSNSSGLFNTFFTAYIIQDITDLLISMEAGEQLKDAEVRPVVSRYNSLNNVNLSTLQDIRDDCDTLLCYVDNSLNELTTDKRAISPNLRKLEEFISSVKSISCFNDVLFKILIDEYENFSKWQQVIINSMVKFSNRNLSYIIGYRSNAKITMETLKAEEPLTQNHDYTKVDLDHLFTEISDFKDHVKHISRIRISNYNEIHGTQYSDDIEYYLGNYDIHYELNCLFKSVIDKNREFRFVDVLRSVVRLRCQEEGEPYDDAVKILCRTDTANGVLDSRINLAILLRDTNRKSISDLCAMVRDNTDTYQELRNHNKVGALFLLLKEEKSHKLYFGYDYLIMLSSSNVRTFMMLCSAVFDLLDGDHMKIKMSPEVQDEAFRKVSSDFRKDLAVNPPLSDIADCLGWLFRATYVGYNNRLSEPEQNHFSFRDEHLSETVDKILSKCQYHSVLIKKPSNKNKEDSLVIQYDYHLNPILAPYYEISLNSKHKMNLTYDDMMKIFTDDPQRRSRFFQEKYNYIVGSNKNVPAALNMNQTKLNIWWQDDT